MRRAARDRAAARDRLERRRLKGRLDQAGVTLSPGVTLQMVHAAHGVYLDTIQADDFPFSDLQMVASMLGAAIRVKRESSGAPSADVNTYFITDGDAIKIGAATNVAARLASLQTSHPKPLSVVGVVIGGDERSFHETFAKHRIRGEWFGREGSLADFVDANFQTPGAVVAAWNCRF